MLIRVTTSVIILLSAIDGTAQPARRIQSISLRSTINSGGVVLRFHNGVRLNISTVSSGKIENADMLLVRIFRGTVSEKLKRRTDRDRNGCYLYDTVIVRPLLTQTDPEHIILDFGRTIDERWVGDPDGTARAKDYTFVIERVSNWIDADLLQEGAARNEELALAGGPRHSTEEDNYDAYFAHALDVRVDPGDASGIRAVYTRTFLGGGCCPAPPNCTEPVLEPQPVLIVRDQVSAPIAIGSIDTERHKVPGANSTRQ